MISIRVLLAVPAYPYPITFTQPNGDTLTVKIMGDERIHWYQSMDGYTLLFDKTGYLTYALLDEEGNLQPSSYIATNIENRDVVINSLLNTIEKYLFYSDIQKQLMLKVWQIEDEIALQHKIRNDKGLIGEYKTLCALVQFPGKPMTKAKADFDGLMNQLGYTGNQTGSVRDFFRESSYGKFDLTITLCGIYTAPNESKIYASDARELARWCALQVAAEPDINFSDYDSNGSGMVDGFHFIFAGLGREAGGGDSAIWSHQWSFSPPVSKNGKFIMTYSCSPELLKYTQSITGITTIGVICHEMTHAFGAPDFYDTDYETGGGFNGTGYWDIMASGSWNGSPGGNRPPHHNMYSKIQFGWVTPMLLEKPVTIVNMPNSKENAVAYKINTPTYDEYYLLENRQQLGFDTEVPGSGLLIYHASNVGTYCINCNNPQRMYPVCASSTFAFPNSSPTSYGNINSAGCPFPGTSNNTTFDGTSTPRMFYWTNTAIKDKPISNITHSNKLIGFDFMGGGCPIVNNMSVKYSDDCNEAVIRWNGAEKKGSKSLLWNNLDGIGTNGIYSVRWAGPTNNRIVMADDFDVPDDESWAIDEVSFYGFPGASSNQPEHIGVAFYKDNGNNRPTNIPFYENALLYPAEGIVSGFMTVRFPAPVAIEEAGKYWISVYGAYDGTDTPYRQYYVRTSSIPKAATMCRWDPQNKLGSGIYYPGWAPTQNTELPTMGFSLSGYKPTESNIHCNLYRDGVKIAEYIKDNSFVDKDFDPSKKHTWSVTVLCLTAGEGDKIEITKGACLLDIENPYFFDNVKVYSYSNVVYIQNNTDINYQSIEILDMMGKLIYQNKITDKNTTIPLHISNGIYCVKLVSQDNKITVKKVLITK